MECAPAYCSALVCPASLEGHSLEVGSHLPLRQYALNTASDRVPHPFVGVSMKVLAWFEGLAISLAYLIVWHRWPSKQEREQVWEDWYE